VECEVNIQGFAEIYYIGELVNGNVAMGGEAAKYDAVAACSDGLEEVCFDDGELGVSVEEITWAGSEEGVDLCGLKVSACLGNETCRGGIVGERLRRRLAGDHNKLLNPKNRKFGWFIGISGIISINVPILGVRPPSAIDEHNSILSAPESSAIRALSKLSTHTSIATIINYAFLQTIILGHSKGLHRLFEI